VPAESERRTEVIFVSGSLTSGFVAAIAGSVDVVISPAKIEAIVWASSRSWSTPPRPKRLRSAIRRPGPQ
jgi:hypothetical protein